MGFTDLSMKILLIATILILMSHFEISCLVEFGMKKVL